MYRRLTYYCQTNQKVSFSLSFVQVLKGVIAQNKMSGRLFPQDNEMERLYFNNSTYSCVKCQSNKRSGGFSTSQVRLTCGSIRRKPRELTGPRATSSCYFTVGLRQVKFQWLSPALKFNKSRLSFQNALPHNLIPRISRK